MGRFFFFFLLPFLPEGRWWDLVVGYDGGGGAGRPRDGDGGGGGGGKGFTALLGGDQFMGIQPGARYSLNASSGGMQRHQLECVRR